MFKITNNGFHWQIISLEICQNGKFELTKYAKMLNCVCMTLKELRKKHKLTQKEAALIVGIPYRTYIRYEDDELYQSSYKYKKILEDLNNCLKIDEEHGVLSIQTIKELLIPILSKYNITYCYLFGSYARGEARNNSDVDLLVDTDITGLSFLQLVEEIRTTLNKKIDILRLCDLQYNNPIILQILKEVIKLL